MLLFLPELTLIVMFLLFFFMALTKKSLMAVRNMALVLSAMTVLASLYSYSYSGMFFFDSYQVDHYSQFFKILLTFGLFLVIYLSYGLTGVNETLHAEYYMFLASGTLGLVMISSAVELITLLIALEISSISVYFLIHLESKKPGDRDQMEAGLKYMLFGVMTTGITLCGMSYMFGLAHSTHISELAVKLPLLIHREPMAVIGLVMLLCGFFFKLALFPMHFWVHDIYQGTSGETSTYIATLPKIGATVLLIRLYFLTGTGESQLTFIIAVLSVLSMTLGNFYALVQKDLKGLIAYSSVAHAGYLMIGIISGIQIGIIASVYYITGYLFMNLACFYVIYHASPTGKNLSLTDLEGLYKRSPLLAFTLTVGALAMAGVPPTLGFTGKLLLFTAGINSGLYAVVILAVINTGISAFYYLKIIRAVYRTTEKEMNHIEIPFSARCYGAFLTCIILFLGVLPHRFIEIIKEAVLSIGLPLI